MELLFRDLYVAILHLMTCVSHTVPTCKSAAKQQQEHNNSG
jgi:hypothetical protein